MANNNNNVKLVFKIVESVAWVIGPAVFALNLFSFHSGKSGVYYGSGSDWGLAIGVLFISLAFVARKWQK